MRVFGPSPRGKACVRAVIMSCSWMESLDGATKLAGFRHPNLGRLIEAGDLSRIVCQSAASRSQWECNINVSRQPAEHSGDVTWVVRVFQDGTRALAHLSSREHGTSQCWNRSALLEGRADGIALAKRCDLEYTCAC